jgi:hypothetical protein
MAYGFFEPKKYFFFFLSGMIIVLFSIHSMINRAKTFEINYIDIILLVILLYYLFRLLLTDNFAFFNQRPIVFILLLIDYYIFKTLLRKHFNNLLTNFYGRSLIISLISVSIILSLISIFQLYGILPSYGQYFTFAGTFHSPVPVGLLLSTTICFSVGLHLFMEFKSDKWSKIIKYLNIANISLIILILPATESRTAWISSFISILFIVLMKYHRAIKTWIKNQSLLIKSLITISIFATILLSSTILFNYKANSAKGRLLIWEITISKTKDNLIFGLGANKFNNDYNDWQAEWFSKNFQEKKSEKGMLADEIIYPYNEFLLILSEFGVFGLFLAIALILSIYYPTNYFLRKNKILALISLSSIIAIITSALTSFPFYILPIIINLFVFLAIVSSNIDRCFKFTKSSFSKRLINLIVPISLIISVGVFEYYQIRSFMVYSNWYEARHLPSKMALKEYEKISEKINDFRFYHEYGQLLAMDKNYSEALKYLNKSADMCSSYTIYMDLSKVYTLMKDWHNTEKALITADNIVPHKLSQKHKLLILYEKNGEEEKAISMAHEILDSKIKVDNMEGARILEDTRKYLEAKKRIY